ncbi:MAG TPA: hypothetical protein PL070_20535, partial [Flavobacteriales bacterium]|nr:hypothetical protein [Flavobacteriales bacterium]
IEQRVKDWLADNFMLGQKALDKLYHHSAIETYPRSKTMLGSPALRGLNNPMVMRALYQLRKLTNRLIQLDWVDETTQ